MSFFEDERMKIEQVKKCITPQEMRAEIYRLRHYDPMVCAVMDASDYRGLSAEDRYTMLAYHAIEAKAHVQQMVLDSAMLRPPPSILMHGHCRLGDLCVCGGDTSAVRAGCVQWMTLAAGIDGREPEGD